MLMIIGQFVFQPDILTFQEIQRSRVYNYAENTVASGRKKRQFIGMGDDLLTLPGLIYEGHGIGTREGLEQLAEMASRGHGYTVLDGTGYLYGVYTIDNIDETKTLLISNGAARRIDFTVRLVRVDDERVENVISQQ